MDNITEWIDSYIRSDRVCSIPLMTNPGIELLGISVKDAVTNGESHFRVVEALSKKYPDAAACTVIMDLTVEAEAFGAEIVLPDNEVPSVTGRLVSDMSGVEHLRIPSIDTGRVREYLKANRLAATNISKFVFSGCIGPYSLAGRLFGMTEIMIGIYTEPDTIRLLLEKCTEFILEYCLALKVCGTAGVILAEPVAGLLPNDEAKEFSSVYVKKIVDIVQDDGFAVILHNCGNTGHCTDAMVYTGSKGYHFGNKVDMSDALAGCPSDALVLGNLDPVGLFKNKSAADVYAETVALLRATKGHRNFVISSGCDIPPNVPFENISAFYRAIAEYQK